MQHRCFAVTFATFLRAPFFTEYLLMTASEWLVKIIRAVVTEQYPTEWWILLWMNNWCQMWFFNSASFFTCLKTRLIILIYSSKYYMVASYIWSDKPGSESINKLNQNKLLWPCCPKWLFYGVEKQWSRCVLQKRYSKKFEGHRLFFNEVPDFGTGAFLWILRNF